MDDLPLAFPTLRQDCFFPSWLEPRRRVVKALYAVVMEACTGGISTRKVDALVEALGSSTGISKSEVSRICQGLDVQVKAFLSRPLDHARFRTSTSTRPTSTGDWAGTRRWCRGP